MQKINFQNYPSTTTPIDADNLNDLQDNIEEAIDEARDNLEANKLTNIPKSNGRYIKSIGLEYYNNKWCLKVILQIDGNEYTQYYYSDESN